jgi:hypothetical protein
LEEANPLTWSKSLEPEWKRCFTRAAAESADAHRRLRKDQRLESIRSEIEPRVVSNDYMIACRGKRYQVPVERAKPRMRKQPVQIEQRLGGGV